MNLTIEPAEGQGKGRFTIAERTIGGVTHRYWAAAPRSLRDVWEASRRHGERDYLVYEDERYSYADAHRVVAALAHTLAGRFGLGRGDRFAVALRNYPEWVLSFWAGVALGAVAVPLNAWWSGDELAFGLADSGCTVLMADGPAAGQRARGRRAAPPCRRSAGPVQGAVDRRVPGRTAAPQRRRQGPQTDPAGGTRPPERHPGGPRRGTPGAPPRRRPDRAT